MYFPVAAEVQEAFSAEYYPTMIKLWPAIEASIESLEKYYNKIDDSPIHIVSMCKWDAVSQQFVPF